MPYPPRPGDKPITEFAATIFDLIVNRHAKVYIKWTCPGCGERVVSDDPIVVQPDMKIVVPSDLLHTEKDDGTPCMVSVKGMTNPIGFMVIM